MDHGTSFRPDRRRFLKASAAVAGGSLLIGVNWNLQADGGEDANGAFRPNAWVAVHPDGRVEITVAESEMGQGPYTLMPMLVAEELEVPWSSIKVSRAGIDPVYGFQLTGGSTSIKKGWVLLREAGAIGRQLLLQAAARQWGIPVQRCRARDGRVFDDQGRSIEYRHLLGIATTLDLPEKAWLKPPESFRVIGQPLPRTDVPDKVSGRAVYGIDVRLPGQLFATVIHPPVFGGRLESFDDRKARESASVVDVFEIDQGLAIVARDSWSALQAARRIEVTWRDGDRAGFSSADWAETLRDYATREPDKVISSGSPEPSGTLIEAEYLQPFQAHLTMEPMNCTVHFDDGKLRIWAPTQSPSLAYGSAKRLTQNKLERGWHKLMNRVFGGYDDSIEVNTTLLGGGFGRRLKQDFVEEAIQIAARFDVPVQLLWSREEDVQHDYYHPMTYHRLAARLDANGRPDLWLHDVAGGGVSPSGARHGYRIAHQRIRSFNFPQRVPKGPWRSVSPHFNVFAVEHFIDELAHKAGRDPLRYRLDLMPGGRLKHCLETVANRVASDGLSAGEEVGYAAASTFDSHVAEAVVLREQQGKYRVARVYCVIDCGIVINPDIVRQQMESSIVFGLTAALLTEITIEQGRVQQSNFHDVPALRFEQTPEIIVEIIDSQEKPGGLGEPGVPPVAPALANAWLAATGKPVRRLPLRLS
jgi:isoquinoline 1-oxidoreductase beta subunit